MVIAKVVSYLAVEKRELLQRLPVYTSYRIAKKIGDARVLTNLEELATKLGGEGLAFWEKLEQPMEEPE